MSSIEISEKIIALKEWEEVIAEAQAEACLLYTSPSPRDI